MPYEDLDATVVLLIGATTLYLAKRGFDFRSSAFRTLMLRRRGFVSDPLPVKPQQLGLSR